MCYDKNDFRKSIDTLSLEKDLDYTVFVVIVFLSVDFLRTVTGKLK